MCRRRRWQALIHEADGALARAGRVVPDDADAGAKIIRTVEGGAGDCFSADTGIVQHMPCARVRGDGAFVKKP